MVNYDKTISDERSERERIIGKDISRNRELSFDGPYRTIINGPYSGLYKQAERHTVCESDTELSLPCTVIYAAGRAIERKRQVKAREFPKGMPVFSPLNFSERFFLQVRFFAVQMATREKPQQADRQHQEPCSAIWRLPPQSQNQTWEGEYKLLTIPPFTSHPVHAQLGNLSPLFPGSVCGLPCCLANVSIIMAFSYFFFSSFSALLPSLGFLYI